jgi:hypothetical protein
MWINLPNVLLPYSGKLMQRKTCQTAMHFVEAGFVLIVRVPYNCVCGTGTGLRYKLLMYNITSPQGLGIIVRCLELGPIDPVDIACAGAILNIIVGSASTSYSSS